MKVKELRNLLNKLPDDTEVYLRCQTHERPRQNTREVVSIASVTNNIGMTEKFIMFNAERAVRLTSFLPQDSEVVNCRTCVRKQRIDICKSRNKMCDTCEAVCECKLCGNQNVEDDDYFSNKPKYERNPKLH